MSTHRHIPTKGHAAPDPEPTMNQDNKNTKPPRGPPLTKNQRLDVVVYGGWMLALVVNGWVYNTTPVGTVDTSVPIALMYLGFGAYTLMLVVGELHDWVSAGTE